MIREDEKNKTMKDIEEEIFSGLFSGGIHGLGL